MKQREHELQKACITWATLNQGQRPALKWLHAIPNGGARHFKVAAKLKAEGVKPGVPDLFLPVARGGFHGLYIELKIGKNNPSLHQLDWLDHLAVEGYSVHVVRDDVQRFIEIVDSYLKLGPPWPIQKNPQSA